MGIVWEVQSVPYVTHIYGKATYFVKFHTIPIHGNAMGMVWDDCHARECYGSLHQSHTKPTSMGKRS